MTIEIVTLIPSFIRIHIEPVICKCALLHYNKQKRLHFMLCFMLSPKGNGSLKCVERMERLIKQIVFVYKCDIIIPTEALKIYRIHSHLYQLKHVTTAYNEQRTHFPPMVFLPQTCVSTK